MTVITGASQSFTTAGDSQLWGLIAPTSGAKTLKVTWVGTSDIVINCTSWTGVNQTGGTTTFPHGTSGTGTNTIPTLTVTSATGNAVMVTASGSAYPFTGPSQTQTFLETGGSSVNTSGQRAAGATTVISTWSAGANGLWVEVGTDILAAAGVACTPTLTLFGVGRCG
jgi:hypothetical protein